MPALAWSMLIGALFLGFFGFNVLMRKQWSENERFTFPMNIFPRQLFSEEEGENGVRGIFRNKIMWIGFAITLPLALLKGIHHYAPAIPAPLWGDIWGNPTLATYVTDPNVKAFLNGCFINMIFSLLAIMLLVETDILFSIWATFLLFQLLPMFGKMFNFNRFPGYPWEWSQAVGSFIAFAILAIFNARRHLVKVFQRILGQANLVDDSQEAVSYRAAILFILLSVVMLIVWGSGRIWAPGLTCSFSAGSSSVGSPPVRFALKRGCPSPIGRPTSACCSSRRWAGSRSSAPRECSSPPLPAASCAFPVSSSSPRCRWK